MKSIVKLCLVACFGLTSYSYSLDKEALDAAKSATEVVLIQMNEMVDSTDMRTLTDEERQQALFALMAAKFAQKCHKDEKCKEAVLELILFMHKNTDVVFEKTICKASDPETFKKMLKSYPRKTMNILFDIIEEADKRS